MRWPIVCALLLSAAGAASGSPRTDYELAWRRANELAEREQWAAARAEFQKAWEIEHRPILLFNIASTYLHERDVTNARVYYRWYLDVADDPDLAATARERLAQLGTAADKPPTDKPPTDKPPPAAAEPYPAAVIDRPPTLPAGMLALGAGAAIAPYHAPAMTGGVTTSYDVLAVVAARYAPLPWLEVAGELDGVIADPGRSLAMLRAEVALARGALTASARASLAYTFDGASFYDLRLAAPLRWKLTERLALVSSDDHLLITLDAAPRQILLRAPLGVAYQLAPRLHGEIATRLAVAELRAPAIAWLGADYRFLSIAATFVPRRALDIIVAAHLYDVGGDGTVFVRVRR
ncbi:MAG TPA: hypothetical protein VNO30_40135 [Kofleriaceae bacterium]|nr:hypothetical protein [Kofleriaceae bacterium]